MRCRAAIPEARITASPVVSRGTLRPYNVNAQIAYTVKLTSMGALVGLPSEANHVVSFCGPLLIVV